MSSTVSADAASLPAPRPTPVPGLFEAPLTGGRLVGAGILLAAANFIAVLDTTIANVSVSTISGALGASTSQGTYVITSYAVAEAITVPLTGWLANRFGTVRVFILSMVMFGLFSALCGLANSLGMLIAFRVLQGLAGGPLMPLSQTLLLRIFPKEKAPAAIGLWAMTTLVAPIAGPILGGVLCDQYSWPYIFWINVPVALVCGYIGWRMLKRYETTTAKLPIDRIGLVLMVVWVAALQLMLDEGKEKDWFASTEIVLLAVVAVVFFIAFLIWELTERNPIVDLRVFRHRGFTASVTTICLAFGAFFGSVVLTPLWLQGYMGYTATWSGCVSALTGILAVMTAPLVAKMSTTVDARKLVCIGVVWLGLMTFVRAFNTTDMSMFQIGWPLFLQGIGLPLFFVPLTGLALSSVNPEETASAAGLMSFCRTMAGAIATSIVNTSWENDATYFHAELSGLVDRMGDAVNTMAASGMSAEQATASLAQTVQNQAIMLATNHIFMMAAISFSLAAMAVWLAPRPTRVADTSSAH
ncbi:MULTISPECIES: DHA2 family efflux MFS transporter permease subunit [unclassified Herbaspirillum]|uniref:DHA2 family efflux MFS transporter permease subunit n=1 Tax=unclassified Herbaspirillum TaxID=2624150 RepID=UPI001167DF83|nr:MULTISPECIES: DHA2 family efflux MFS transporter permease subunit [unclassified Herbaspirillum]MBB5391949.1 DHA2 family multidrug resistance protein [Herbaspirillum sp. SJZ102]TQK13409.1 DHA2 family multidrug resistance protein [Herbaspirillum sp. SJZ130]TQK15413.1 DHA2 family multidrug resistance protein [Herbaspirillum sp. SJZ106]